MKLLTTCYASDGWASTPSFALIHLNNPQQLLDRMQFVADANAADDTLWHITYHATRACYAKYVNWCEEIEEILDQDNNHDHVMDGFALVLPDDFQVPDDQVASVGMETVVVFPEEGWLEAHLTGNGANLESRRITPDGIKKALAGIEASVVLQDQEEGTRRRRNDQGQSAHESRTGDGQVFVRRCPDRRWH